MIKTYSFRLLAACALVFSALTANAQQRYLDEVFTNAQLTMQTNVAYGYNFSQYVPAAMGGPMVIPMYSDVYMPDTAVDPESARPVVIIFHTGSFLPRGYASPMGNQKDSAVVALAKSFARRGFVVVSASYRLGWLANSTNLDLRRGTNLMAVYNAVQDAKVCVRAVRAKALLLGNPMRVNPAAISLMGAGSGGYITMAYATLDNYAEVATPTKFQYSASGTGIFGNAVTAGAPYVDTARVGDWNGYGGKATIIGAHPVTGLPLVDQTQPGRNIELYKGIPHTVNLSINLGGALGDSAWLNTGSAPIMSFHSRYDFYAPYYRGMVNVPIAGAFFPVVSVAGSHTAVKMSNTLGNNTVMSGPSMMDAYSVKARTNAHNVGGQDNLYTFNMTPPNPAMPFKVNSSPWDWWDAADPLSGNETNPNVKAQSLLYIDTIMAFTLPRLAKVLNATAGFSITIPETADLKLHLVPNPASANAKIFALGAEIRTVEVHDLLGRPVFSMQGVNAHELELPSASWAPGAYFVRIQTDHGQRTTKLIRQ